MNKCLICKNNLTLHYGDEIYGENFCKDCYEKHRCVYCNKMNIDILFDRYKNIIEIIIKRKYGGIVSNDSILKSMFEPGYRFELYCKECWDSQDMYNEDENESVEPEEDDLNYDEYDDNESSEDLENVNDLYHTGKGKYDMY
jgi:hypothetical protein